MYIGIHCNRDILVGSAQDCPYFYIKGRTVQKSLQYALKIEIIKNDDQLDDLEFNILIIVS